MALKINGDIGQDSQDHLLRMSINLISENFLLKTCFVGISIVILVPIVLEKENYWYPVLFGIGVGLISGAIVGYMIHKTLERAATESIKATIINSTNELGKKVSNLVDETSTYNEQLNNSNKQMASINDYLNLDSQIKRNKDLKMIYIYKNRFDPKLKEDIKSYIKKMKYINLLGMTHRDFIKEKGIYQNYFKNFCKNTEGIANDINKAKILIINPFSREGIRRTLLEEVRKRENPRDQEDYIKEFKSNPKIYKDSQTYRDIRAVLTSYKNEFKQSLKDEVDDDPNYNIELKFYNTYPSLWLIITDKIIFYQPYQYGINMDDGNPLDVGEYFIIMAFGEDGYVHKLLSNHFEHIWNSAENLSAIEMWKIIDNDTEIERILTDYISLNETLY